MALTTVFAALMALLAGMIYMLSPLYLVGAVCVLTLAFVALKGPMWGLLLTTFVYNIENTALHVHIADGNDHVDYPVYIVFLLVTLAGWAVHKAFNYHLKRQPTPLDLPLLALFLYQGVSLLWTPSLVLGLHFFLLLCFNMLMFYLLTAIIKTTRQLELVIAFMAVSALIHAVSVFISQWYTPHAELRFDKNIVLSYFALWQMDSRPWGLGGGAYDVGVCGSGYHLHVGLYGQFHRKKAYQRCHGYHPAVLFHCVDGCQGGIYCAAACIFLVLPPTSGIEGDVFPICRHVYCNYAAYSDNGYTRIYRPYAGRVWLQGGTYIYKEKLSTRCQHRKTVLTERGGHRDEDKKADVA